MARTQQEFIKKMPRPIINRYQHGLPSCKIADQRLVLCGLRTNKIYSIINRFNQSLIIPLTFMSCAGWSDPSLTVENACRWSCRCFLPLLCGHASKCILAMRTLRLFIRLQALTRFHLSLMVTSLCQDAKQRIRSRCWCRSWLVGDCYG